MKSFPVENIIENSIKADGAVPDNLLKDLLDKSYQLVFGGLSKKKQKEILETNPQ